MSEDTKGPDRVDRVTSAVWDWREGGQKLADQEAARRRRDSLIQSSILLVTGLTFLFWLEWRHMGTVALALCVVVFVAGRFVPPLHAFLNRAVAGLGHLIGMIITWVLLVPFFYLCFVPARLILAITGKDPMRRKRDPEAASYWDTYKSRGSEHLERQF